MPREEHTSLTTRPISRARSSDEIELERARSRAFCDFYWSSIQDMPAVTAPTATAQERPVQKRRTQEFWEGPSDSEEERDVSDDDATVCVHPERFVIRTGSNQYRQKRYCRKCGRYWEYETRWWKHLKLERASAKAAIQQRRKTKESITSLNTREFSRFNVDS